MTDFVDVVLVDSGSNKTGVIMALRQATSKETIVEVMDLGVAKRFVESPPCVVVPNVPTEVGQRLQAGIEKAGATVELKPA
jgi:ribosomal protein L7/L12